jgi:hypothetical protein
MDAVALSWKSVDGLFAATKLLGGAHREQAFIYTVVFGNRCQSLMVMFSKKS